MGRTGQTLRRRTAQTIGERRHGSAQKAGTGVGLGAKLRYGFDNTMSRGTPALVAWLFAVTVVVVLVFAVFDIVTRLRDPEVGFGEATWQSLMHALDPGAVAADTGVGLRIVMLVLTIVGLFIVSALIGVIAAGIDARIAELRRGRSVVLEKDHTVILGWSESIFTVISELTIANESRRKPIIAVLAPGDKVEMEDEIRAKVADLRGTRIVVRSGHPTDLADIALVSPATARSVIVLSPGNPGDVIDDSFDPDREVVKTLLALRSAEEDAGTAPRVVAQLRDATNLEVARLISKRRAAHTSLLDIRETVAKLVVQTSRQSGAAAVYRELFDYDGDEIYFLSDHGMAASTYAEVQQAFEAVSVIGLVEGQDARLNPPADTVVGDRALVVVAEDDSILASAPRSTASVDESAFAERPVIEERATHGVLIGWNDRAPVIVSELDRYAPPGSTLTVLTAYGEPTWPELSNLEVTVVRAKTTQRAVLDAHVPPDADQVLVVCYADHLGAEAADATTLITLLHVRDILATSSSSTPVVSEMIDDRNRALAQVADVDDVVVSGEIVSLIVSQLSEDSRIEPVLADLLDSDGSEIYLRPAEWYVRPGVETTWATVVASAARRGETALGFASPGLAEAGSRVGVVVNPAKSEPLEVGPGDRVVVLAEV